MFSSVGVTPVMILLAMMKTISLFGCFPSLSVEHNDNSSILFVNGFVSNTSPIIRVEQGLGAKQRQIPILFPNQKKSPTAPSSLTSTTSLMASPREQSSVTKKNDSSRKVNKTKKKSRKQKNKFTVNRNPANIPPSRGRKRRAVRRAINKLFDTIDDVNEVSSPTINKKGASLERNQNESVNDVVANKNKIHRQTDPSNSINNSSNPSKQHSTTITRTLEERAMLAFDDLDTDGDGELSKEEMADMGLRMYVFSLLDDNGDGTINRDEFNRAVALLRNRVDVFGENPNSKSNQPHDISAIVEELESNLRDLAPLERQEFRLDGFEPYIFVSVLTAEAAFDEISDFSIDWNVLAHPFGAAAVDATVSTTTFGEEFVNLCTLLTTGGATLTGMYATVVFSLTMLYGKGAIGMERDQEYAQFMKNTMTQRRDGFRAFTISGILFFVSVILEVCQKLPPSVFIRLPFLVTSSLVLYIGWVEYNKITSAAAPMFSDEAKNNPVAPMFPEEVKNKALDNYDSTNEGNFFL